MSGARTMQELRYFRDGATLVISLDGLNWLSKRRCSDKGIKKRNEELRVLISSGPTIEADEEPQTITCIVDQTGSAAPRLRRNSDSRSSRVTGASAVSTSPRHRCLPVEHRSTLTPFASFVSERPKEAPWTKLILNMRDIFSLIRTNSNIVAQPGIVDNRFIIVCDEDIPLQRFGDTFYTEDCRTSTGDSAWHSNVFSDLENYTAHGPNTSNSNVNQGDLVIRDDFNDLKSLMKSYQIHSDPGGLPLSNTNVKKRSVSFDDDVMVYMFDRESPTMELHSEASASLPDVTLEDSGLEWEDDFSALEKNCHFQCVGNSQQHTLSLSPRSSAALSRRLYLPQTCLFLTHVTDSDLDL